MELHNQSGDVIYSADAENIGQCLEQAAKEGVVLKDLQLKDHTIVGTPDKPLKLDGLKIPGALIEKVRIENVSMNNAALIGAKTKSVVMRNVSMRNNVMNENTSLAGVMGINVDMQGSNLAHVKISNGSSALNLSNSDIRDTNIAESGVDTYGSGPYFGYLSDEFSTLQKPVRIRSSNIDPVDANFMAEYGGKIKKPRIDDKHNGMIYLHDRQGTLVYGTKASSLGECLEKAAAENIELDGIVLNNRDISGTKNKPLKLKGLKMPYAVLNNVRIRHADMDGADISAIITDKVKMNDVSIQRAKTNASTSLAGVSGVNVNLEGTPLNGVKVSTGHKALNLTASNLQNTDISQANVDTFSGHKYFGALYDEFGTTQKPLKVSNSLMTPIDAEFIKENGGKLSSVRYDDKHKGTVYLHSKDGKVLFAAKAANVGKALEQAAKQNVKLKGLQLKGQKISGTKDATLKLDGLRIPGALIEKTTIENASMNKADISNISTDKVTLENVSMQECITNYITSLSGVTGKNVNLDSTNLSHVGILGSSQGLQLSDSTLTNTNITKSGVDEYSQKPYFGALYDEFGTTQKPLKISKSVMNETDASYIKENGGKLKDIRTVPTATKIAAKQIADAKQR